MTRALKIAGISLASLLLVIVLLVAALLLFVDPNDYKADIATVVKEKTDMTLAINDRLEWALWPSLGVRLGKVSFSDEAAKETLIAVNKAAVSVQVLPLFSGKIAVDEVLLDGTRVRFIQYADGRTSWDKFLSKLSSSEEEKSSSDKVDFKVQRIDVTNGDVFLQDHAAKVERHLEAVTLKARDIGWKQPFPLNFGFTFTQKDAAGKTTVVNNTLDTVITLDQDAQRYVLSPLNMNTDLSGTALPYPMKVFLQSALMADVAKSELQLDKFIVDAEINDAARPLPISLRLATVLNTNWATGALAVSTLDVSGTVSDKAWPKPLQFSLSAPIKGNWKSGEIDVPTLVLNAIGTKTQGNLSARLPALQSTEPGTPITKGMNIAGKLATAAFNPRDVMAALAIAAPKTADANVLKRAAFSTDIAGNDKQVLLKNIKLSLDDSTLSGEAGINDLVSMRQYARLNLDKFDADRYLPPASKAAPAAEKTDAAATTAASSTSANAPLLPVELLRSLNFDIGFTAGSLKAMGYPMSNFQAAATASQGVVKVSALKGSIYSGGFNAPLTLNVQGKQPVISAQPSLQKMEIGPLVTKFMGKQLLSGKASMDANLSMNGNSVNAIKQSIKGTANLSFDNGVLHGVNAMQQAVDALGKYKALLALTGKDADAVVNKQKDTEIASFSAKNTLDKGLLTTTSLDADLKKAKVSGTGRFNLVSQDIDYGFQLKMDKSVVGERNAAYALPVKCKGNLAGNMASLCNLDSKAISQIALKAAAGGALEKLGLGGGAADPAVQQKADEAKQKAKEKINDALNKWLNR